ncbi:MAG: energy-coupling factor transporter ATPase [Oscillospiraceae bacterium]
MAIIKTENLTHIYSPDTPFEKAAINGLNIEIEEGKFVGIMGHTGSGKSTFIQHLNGLLKPTSGKIYIDGEDIWKDKQTLRQTRFKVGLVFQYPEYQLFEETVYKDIAFGPKNMGLSEDEIDSRVREAAGLVGIDEKMLKKSPFDLSGGQKRRAAIAGVMAMKPKILILDEPTAGLDPYGRDKILEEIDNYHEQTKSTVLLVSHSMEDIAKHAEQILVMNKSEIFCFGETADVFKRAEEIEKIGLDIPQISKIAARLRENGVDIGDVYTVGAAAERIIRLLEGGALRD